MVKRHRNFDTKTVSREPQQNCRLGTVSNELHVCVWGGGGKLVLRDQPHPQPLNKTFSWLFGSHDNPLTRQWIITVYSSRTYTMKKQRRGLNRYNVLRDRWRSLEI